MMTDLEAEYLRLPGLQEDVIDAWEATPAGSTATIVAELNLLTALRAIARARTNTTRVPALDSYVAAHAEALTAEAGRAAPLPVAADPQPEPVPMPAGKPDPAPPIAAPPNDDEDLPPP